MRVLVVTLALAASATAQVPTAWTQVSNGGPSGRSSIAMAMDQRRGVAVLFGGLDSMARLDTWEWDGNVWTQVSQTGPSRRLGHDMAYDSQRGVTVLFGGFDSPGRLGDTWEWDGATWTQVSATGPAARDYHSMVFDTVRNVTLLFGGETNTGYVGDTWSWNGVSWLQHPTASAPPAARSHAMAFDTDREVTVLFGGAETIISAGFVFYGETWEWDGAVWTRASTTGPNPRYAHRLAYDPIRGTTILFGGRTPPGIGILVNDTWEWDGTTWSPLSNVGPLARQHFGMVYDAGRRVVTMFGGRASPGRMNDTWELPPGPFALALEYGAGCGNLTLSPTTGAPPLLGTTASVTLANAPATFAFVALGFSDSMFGNFPLPVTLGAYGLNGCDLLQSADIGLVPVALTAGSGTYDLAIPNQPTFVGVEVFLQGFASAPGANPGNAILSNGIEWVFGTY